MTTLQLKTPEQIGLMRAAGLVVADALAAVVAAAAPGVTPRRLDATAAEVIAAAGAQPSFLGYGYPPYPAVTCISVNDAVVHGIPGDVPLREGDLVSVDCGAVLDGWHGDAAVTVGVGDVRREDAALSAACEDALWAGIAAATAGARLRDVGAAVEDAVERAGRGPFAPPGGYGILEDYTGHGIGTEMHMPPAVPNFRVRARGPRLSPGLAIAIEPMLTLGSPEVRVLGDRWTVCTADGSRAAHWEHTVAITSDGPWVLTAHDGGAHRLGALGVATPATTS
jgi:methionyl aminopeptidase